MNPQFRTLTLVALVGAAYAESQPGFGSAGGGSAGGVEAPQQVVSPPVKQSDKKFFGKDYPWDKRPPVTSGAFHFKHPYPVVQDSNDFDADYVKDENSDNGSWKAQTEYDRLRHKLAKEKADVAKAMAKKSDAEKELQDAMKRHQKAVKDRAEVMARTTTTKKPSPEVQSSEGKQVDTDYQRVKKEAIPGGIASPGDVKVATTDTERAMDALEECKKQLAQAREELKKQLGELEEAKKVQRKTQETLDEAVSREENSENGKKQMDKSSRSEYKEYMDAREAYLKQQATLAKMENDIEAAAAKVKAIRDAEDKQGGVYNSGHKNAAHSFESSPLAFILGIFATLACLVQ